MTSILTSKTFITAILTLISMAAGTGTGMIEPGVGLVGAAIALIGMFLRHALSKDQQKVLHNVLVAVADELAREAKDGKTVDLDTAKKVLKHYDVQDGGP